MKCLIIIIPFILCSCANVSSTRLSFKNDKSNFTVEIPKEIESQKMRIIYDSQQGTFEITADSWISKNQGTIESQSLREKEILESSSVLIEKTVEGAVKGAIKGVVPIP